MTDLRKAAEMALEVLETTWGDGSEYALKEWKETIQALRQALAQPEQGNSSPNYPITESNTSLDKIVEQAIQGHASTRDAIRWAMQQEREAIIEWLVEDGFFVKDGPLSEKVRTKLHHSIYFDVNRRYTPEVTPEVTGEVTGDVDAVNMTQERVDETAKRKHEPVVWVVQYKDRHEFVWGSKPEFRGGTVLAFQPLYMAPPKREWVGLTEYQRLKFADGMHIPLEAVEKIEAKLKEKNSG